MTRAAGVPKPRELTLEAYLALPETKTRQEVVDGVITPLPAPTLDHQEILGRLYLALAPHVTTRDLGKVLLSPLDVLIRAQPKLRTRQPDLVFVGNERLAGASLRGQRTLRIAPDLAVEILSPSETKGRWSEKLADYASIDVHEVWLIEPDAGTVEILGLEGGAYVRRGLFGRGQGIASAVLPDLALDVDTVLG